MKCHRLGDNIDKVSPFLSTTGKLDDHVHRGKGAILEGASISVHVINIHVTIAGHALSTKNSWKIKACVVQCMSEEEGTTEQEP